VIYIDTSALVKLIWQEPESPELARYLADRDEDRLVSSALLAIETRRTVLREDPTQLPRADLLLTRVGQVAISDPIVESASRLPDAALRSLDAIHLATALLLGREVDVLVSYDKRMCSAAQARAIATASPG
jgi:predicted nucleic acid-binding protein